MPPNAGGGREAVQAARPISTVLRNVLSAMVPDREHVHRHAAYVVVSPRRGLTRPTFVVQ
jgi:hypothetical protein